MFLQLGIDSLSNWYCKSCLAATIPFQNISQNQFLVITGDGKKAHDSSTNSFLIKHARFAPDVFLILKRRYPVIPANIIFIGNARV